MTWKERVLTCIAYLRDKSYEHGYVCEFCQGELFDYPKHRICENCASGFKENADPVCSKCGRKTETPGVCLLCKSCMPKFDQGVSAFEYYENAASAINRIKNGNRRTVPYVTEKMTLALLRRCPELEREFGGGRYEMDGKKLLIVSVPLSKKRRRKRGYNQAEDLAKRVAMYLREEGFGVETDFEVLEKRKDTSSQKDLTGAERMENLSGAFHVHKRTICKDRIILLVDDIMTTGATGSTCAKLLKGAGAKRIYFLTACAIAEQNQD